MRSRWRKWEKRFLQYRRGFKRVRRLIWSGGGGVNGPNNGTDLPWLERGDGFLAVFSERTGTAMAQASTIDDAHGAIALRPAFLHG